MLAKAFAVQGFQVTFVERSHRNIFGLKLRRESDIKVVSVFALPYLKGYFLSIFKLNDWLIRKQLGEVISPEADAWHLLSSPLWAEAVGRTKPMAQKLVYDISDNHLDFATNDIWKMNLKKYEDNAIRRASAVTITSENLASKLPKNKRYLLLENGVDLTSSAAAKPVLQDKFQGKIVGFIGGVYKRVDLELVAKCSQAYPETNFVVIGPTDQASKLASLDKLPNFHYLGSIPWNEIQDYFASLDVGIVPFVSEAEFPWLRTVDSVKVYQYAYFGYPIVVTKYGNVESLKPLVAVAENSADFVSLVGKALTGEEPASLATKRKQLAKEHDWAHIAAQMAKFVVE
jgi:hypothetical protein